MAPTPSTPAPHPPEAARGEPGRPQGVSEGPGAGDAAARKVRLFCQAFSEIGPGRPVPVDVLYEPSIVFEDPFGRFEGIEAVRAHFARFDRNVRRCWFEHGRAVVSGDEAMLPWTMHLDLVRGPRHTIRVAGVSHVRFLERVVFQRDYFDAGALVYEHIPVLGLLIRGFKSMLAPASKRRPVGPGRSMRRLP